MSIMVIWRILILGVFRALSRFLFSKHLLCLLLSLELVLVMLFSIILCIGEIYISLIYLVMGVCEGAVGISLLVAVSRAWGGNYVAGYRLRRC